MIDDINEKIKKNNLLHVAIKKNSSEMFESLLEYSDEETVSGSDSEGNPVLNVVLQERNMHCYELLLKKFPLILSSIDKDKNTPCHTIAKLGYLEAYHMLKEEEREKYLNTSNKKQETPLHVAVRENKEEMIKLFLSHGANPTRKTADRSTLLHIACQNGNSNSVRIILESINCEKKKKELIDFQNNSKATPLILAAKKGYVDCYRAMEIANPNLKDNTGKTALHYATQKGYQQFVEYLLKHNADINVKDQNKNTPLLNAASLYNEKVIDCLLERVEEIDDKTAKQLLHDVSKKGNEGCLKVLLNGAHGDHVRKVINDAPNGQKRPLHISLEKGNYKITTLLLEHGADKKIKDESTEEYPLHLAARQKGLPSRDDEEERQMMCKIIVQDSHQLVHSENNENETPLHLAARSGNHEMILSLLRKGAKLTTPDNNGFTPIHIASENGNVEALKKLLKDNVNNCKLKDIEAMKPHPLYLAAAGGYLDCCKLIIQRLKVTNYFYYNYGEVNYDRLILMIF